MKRSAADGLVIDARGDARAVRRQPEIAVIVGDGGEALGTGNDELRDDSSADFRIGPEDRVETLRAGDRRLFGDPGRRRTGRTGVVKGDAEGGDERLEE